jgi:hypothetical protein
MSTLAATTATRFTHLRSTFARTQRPSIAVLPTVHVAANNYIPSGTADMWRSSKRSFGA